MKTIELSDKLCERLDAIRKEVDKKRPLDGVVSALVGWYELVMDAFENDPPGAHSGGDRSHIEITGTGKTRGLPGHTGAIGVSHSPGLTGPTGWGATVAAWSIPAPVPEEDPLIDVARRSRYTALFADAWAQYPAERAEELKSGERVPTPADEPTPAAAYILAGALLDRERHNQTHHEACDECRGIDAHADTCRWARACQLAQETLANR